MFFSSAEVYVEVLKLPSGARKCQPQSTYSIPLMRGIWEHFYRTTVTLTEHTAHTKKEKKKHEAREKIFVPPCMLKQPPCLLFPCSLQRMARRNLEKFTSSHTIPAPISLLNSVYPNGGTQRRVFLLNNLNS